MVQSGCFCTCLAKCLTSFFFCLHSASKQGFLGKGLALCVLGFSFTFEHERIVVCSRSVKRETFSFTLSGSSWDVRLDSLCLKESEWKETFNSVIRSGDQ